MGRLFLVEHDPREGVLKACKFCNTYIALHQNITQDTFPFWPPSQGSIFSSTVNLVENDGGANQDLPSPALFLQLYCVKCGAFIGFRQYYDSTRRQGFSFICHDKVVDIFTNGD
ncbi:protein yippee-like At3g11230 isoform X2 [Cucurbita moschata]|uniref:Protein yippee-like At3g11230 isoform X2 n=1 Tax=Cucurbita moschata TaxID=3662 RepID=A0A6J1G703_CUCMO|nr:protein yippee-like At3g11230 isoform X2 [Cucurbita moschata]